VTPLIRFATLSSKVLPVLLVTLGLMASAVAQEVDVYFITGQSNATNIGESSGADGISGDGEIRGAGRPFTDVGFNLQVARVGDRPSRDADITNVLGDDPGDFGANFPNTFQPNYSSSNLNDGTAITALATSLHDSNDLAIFTFARGGRPLSNTDDDGGGSWFPGVSDISNPANQFNDELYGTFLQWSADRINEVENGPDGLPGTADDVTAVVKGIFWFQGEADVSDGTTGAYQTNYTNLIARFREDFGAELPFIASEIRVTNGATNISRQNEVNAALQNVAAADPLVGVIEIDDLIPQGNNNADVHLDRGRQSIPNQYIIVAERFAAELNQLDQNMPTTEPEPQPKDPVETSSSAPTTDVIQSALAGTTSSTLFSEGANTNHARGQLFPLGVGAGNGFDITAITVRKSGTQTYNNDTMTIRIFEGTSAQFATGTGHTTTEDGSNYFVDTTITEIHTESFSLTGIFSNNDYVTFNFANPVAVGESGDFGFLLTYERGDGTPETFSYREGTSGDRVAVLNDDHRVSSRSFVYAVQGVARVPSITVLPPEVAVSQGAQQRSMLTDIDVTFTGNVQFGNGAFSVVNREDDGSVDVGVTSTTVGDNTVATLTFSGQYAEEQSGSLVDGNYVLTIDGSQIVDSQGNDYDVDGNGSPGGVMVLGDQASDNFYRLFGDIDRDRLVSIFDFFSFRGIFSIASSDPSFEVGFDFDTDGIISIFDFFRFRENFNRPLAFE